MASDLHVTNMSDQDDSDTGDSCTLNLSFESSSFDEDSEVDVLEVEGGIFPYQFEPYQEPDVESEDSDETDNNNNAADDRPNDLPVDRTRLTVNEWCHCSKCAAQPTTKECLCCTEINEVMVLMDGENGCITDHPGFEPVCLNLHVLRTAYYQYRQQYRDEMAETPERNRYIAYRQFVRWCWGFLGRHNRVPIPACVVKKIREVFPSDGRVGFKEAE